MRGHGEAVDGSDADVGQEGCQEARGGEGRLKEENYGVEQNADWEGVLGGHGKGADVGLTLVLQGGGDG